ncbi:MAG: hypothetical protein HY820_06855 [Acidobacteria bacterium]|nr:hypothetical protein [Acidobacteriota bacterium]
MKACAALLIVFHLAAFASAQPVLRLSNTVIGPEAFGGTLPLVPVGRMLTIHNIGDGPFSPAVTLDANAPWLTLLRLDRRETFCNADFLLSPRGMAPGVYSATVRISEPSSREGPQSVVFVIHILPSLIDSFVEPGRSRDYPLLSGFCNRFSPCPSATTTTENGIPWLSVVTNGVGTLGFSQSVRIAPPKDMEQGVYRGQVALTQPSTVDRAIPVTLHVASGPIAAFEAPRIALNLAEGGPWVRALPFHIFNSGSGTLEIGEVRTGSSRLRATWEPQRLQVEANPEALPPGVHIESLSVECNAANCPLEIQVFLQVARRRPPLILRTYQMGDVVTVTGEQFTFDDPVDITSTPLPIALADVEVRVGGRPAPIFSLGFDKLLFLLPGELPDYTAIQVIRGGEASNAVPFYGVTPHIVGITDAGGNPVSEERTVRPGDLFIIWASGLGRTMGEDMPQVRLLGKDVESVRPIFAAPSPGSPGLYQVVVAVPKDQPPGVVRVQFPRGNTVSLWVR